MIDVEQTIVSQYSTSPTLTRLVRDMNEYIDPQADLDNFLKFVWDVQTAKGFGLDYWGKIVNVSRDLTIPGAVTFFGFSEAVAKSDDAPQPFGQASFYTGKLDTQTYRLDDDAYRTLILAKALTNISACTAPSLNRLLQNLFARRGRCYVSDLGNMRMRFTFEFYLKPPHACCTASRPPRLRTGWDGGACAPCWARRSTRCSPPDPMR
ncbi:MAG: DUF2612 domain-containing protein [Burkholderia gladioli]